MQPYICVSSSFPPLWLLLTTLSSLQVLSEAQHEAGYCSFYEECGRNPLIEQPLIDPVIPCLNYSRARPITGEHYTKLKQVCRSR